ncbi:MAG: hypothetical protein ABI791_01080 [Acidobacteriota bacterium]
MSEEERDNAKPADQVRVTTQENAIVETPAGGWQMPEPVYRNSSGYLPQGFEKQFPQPGAAEPATPPAVAPSVGPQASAAAPAAAVEPQPDLIEILAAEPPVAPVIARPGRSPLSIVLIIIGLIVMAAVVLGFIAVVYYLFLAAPAETSF